MSIRLILYLSLQNISIQSAIQSACLNAGRGSTLDRAEIPRDVAILYRVLHAYSDFDIQPYARLI